MTYANGSICVSGSECGSGCCYNLVCEPRDYCPSLTMLWWLIVIWVVVAVLICACCILIIVCIVKSCNRQTEANNAAMVAMQSHQQH